MMEIIKEVIHDIAGVPLRVEFEYGVIVLSSFLFCQILYKTAHWYFHNTSPAYRELPLVDKKEWLSRLASNFHGIIVFPVSVYIFLYDDPYYHNPIFGTSNWTRSIMALGVGYFASDLIVILIHKIPPLAPIILHHVFAGWGFAYCLGQGAQGMWFGSALLMTEATSVFNNTHWMLSKSGLEEKNITKIVGYLFALNWIVFRIIIPDFIVYRLFVKWDDFLAMKTTSKLILGTNMVFLTLMNHIYFVTGPFYELVFGKAKKKDE